MSYLAAQAKYHAKQSTDNVYHIAARREVTSHDVPYNPPPRYLSSSTPLPPPLDQIAQGHAHHRVLTRITEEHSLNEYEQKV